MKKLLYFLISFFASCDTVLAQIDSTEYPVGITNYTIVAPALTQLQSCPPSRYRKGHTLLPFYSVIDPIYFGGYKQTGVTDPQAIHNQTDIQRELIKPKFNYMITLNWFGPSAYTDSCVTLANLNPNVKAAIGSLRAQVSGGSLMVSQSLPNANYLQNSSGTFLDLNGNPTSAPFKVWRPTAPVTDYSADGTDVRSKFQASFTGLTRSVDWNLEDGEVYPFISVGAMASDPNCVSQQAAWGLTWPGVGAFPNYLFAPFLGKSIAINDTAYSHKFMSLPNFSANKKYTEYRLDGNAAFNFAWQEIRKLQDTINGQYYSTGDLYVRWPYNWQNWISAWHGLKWFSEGRYYELLVGDRLFSPFTGAGWDNDETQNVRPAQWLGLLKVMAIWGAEFYYPSYFVEADNTIAGVPPNPKGYAWQAVIPSYAQAVTSYYEDVLRNGSPMPGDMTDATPIQVVPKYQFNTGVNNKLVFVRKWNNKFVILGIIENDNNIINSTPLTSTATFTLEGEAMTINLSRWGNTYIYDKSDAANKIFYQLDAWHEHTHPTRWSQDIIWDAEVTVTKSSGVSIKTEGIAVGNYTGTNSYIKLGLPTDSTSYSVQRSAPSAATRYFWVHARSPLGVSTGMTVRIGSTTKTICGIIDNTWKWYRVDSASNTPISFTVPSDSAVYLVLKAQSWLLDIDKFALLESSADVYGATLTSCNNVNCSITPSGPLSFCPGGSVTLTGNASDSYLWSTGATTQAITVSTTGTYTLTITTGIQSVQCTPESVTVYSSPTATITANGPTTFCTGGNVTLTVTSNSSYLWSTGATTQSISPTTTGNYSCTVTDANGCTKQSSATAVLVNTYPTASITAGSATSFCAGGNVILTAATGSGYTFQWKRTAVDIAGATSSTYTATIPGAYTVMVTKTGCSLLSNSITVTVTTAPTTSNAGLDQSVCTDSTYFTGNVPTFGTGLWTLVVGSGTITTPSSATSKVTGLGVGANIFKWTISNSPCTSSQDNVTITRTSASPVNVTIFSNKNPYCIGDTITFNAVAVNGGIATYQWKKNNINVGINSATYTTTVNNGDAIKCVLTSSLGCATGSPATSNTITQVLSTVTSTITAGGATSFCLGGSVVLTANSGSNLTYQWKNSGGSIAGETNRTYTATTTESYGCVVTNLYSCTALSNLISVTANSVTAPVITPTGSTTICFGDSILLTSTSAIGYTWSNGATTQSIYTKIAGTYFVTVSGGGGCTATSAGVSINVRAAINALVTPPSAQICTTDSLLLISSPSNYTYLWNNGATTKNIYATSSGTYVVTLTGGVGCTSTASSIITTVSCTGCIAPTSSSSIAKEVSAQLDWQTITPARDYLLELTNDQCSTCAVQKFTFNKSSAKINHLNQNTQYHYRIQSVCGLETISDYSIIFYFKTTR